VNRVCLTHIGHDSLGGLPGMILTSADVVDSVKREMQNSLNKSGGGTVIASGGTGGDKQYRNNHGRSFNNNGNNRKRNGSLLSNDEDGVPDLEIVGPEGTNAFLHSLRHFVRRDRFKIHAHEGQYDSSLNDNKVHESLNAKKKAKKKKSKVTNDNELVGFDVKSIPISYDACEYPQNHDERDLSTQVLPITKQAVSYLFTTPPIPGKFLINKAQELNVPRGPMYSKLKAGKSVTFIDPNTKEERTVTSEEVVAKSSPGVGVVVVYCPTLKVLSELKDVETFGAFENCRERESAKPEERVELDLMVHLTPKSIFHDPAYQSWCKGFGTEVEHITLHAAETLEDRVMDDENSPFVSGICGAIRRSFVHDQLFPMPLPTFPSSSDERVSGKATCDAEDLSTIKGCLMMDYTLMPRSRRGLDKSSMKSLYSTNKIDDLKKRVNESGAIEHASSVVSSNRKEIINSGQGECDKGLGELIFTGTGSAVPCKHRNVTGMYLRMNNGNSILLDVGEGTVGQLLRCWKSTLSSNQSPTDEYRSRLSGIKAVWISHPHADHHLGLLRLLSERAAICGPNDPVVLMAPHDMFDFLHEYRSVVPEISQSYIPVDCYDMIHGRVNPLGKKLYEDLGITNCISVPVAHCLRSYAVVIEGTSFGKVAYSGDCRPSNRFADVGFGTDLLIHEATFENGMEEDAVLKRHSTVGEAIDIASKMNAKSLVLTHFSQRYPKIPSLKKSEDKEKAAEEISIPVAIAFDFMRLTPNTIDLAAKLTPALRLLYPREGGDEAEMATEMERAKELMARPGVFAAKGVL